MILRDNIEISKAKTEDIELLIPFLKLLFSIEKDFIFNKKKHIKGLNLLINNSSSFIFLVRFKNKIIAMLSIQILISTAIGAKTALIEDFVVLEKYQNMGVGSYLLDFLKKYAKENSIKRIQLLCDNDNTKAEKFYSKKSLKKSNLSAWYMHINI